MERSLAFYRDLMGMQVTLDIERTGDYIEQVVGFPGAHLRIVGLKLPSGSEHILELIEYKSPRGQRVDTRTCNPGTSHFCFVTDDIQATYEEMCRLGVRFKSPPIRIPTGPSTGGYDAYFLDPDDITLELSQKPKAI
jgi:catechol 2,3-dioxygenase-like lactoylglutathione lyase family enzyme